MMKPPIEDYLDRLIAAGWADVEQPRIPVEVMEAAKAGHTVPVKPKFWRPSNKPKRNSRGLSPMSMMLNRRRF
jgi:hypothetical protein